MIPKPGMCRVMPRPLTQPNKAFFSSALCDILFK